jgi:hypothetical protein
MRVGFMATHKIGINVLSSWSSSAFGFMAYACWYSSCAGESLCMAAKGQRGAAEPASHMIAMNSTDTPSTAHIT